MIVRDLAISPDAFAGIQLRGSSYNLFERNTFINILNGNQSHAFYCGGESTHNVVRNNTILDSDGDVFKVSFGVCGTTSSMTTMCATLRCSATCRATARLKASMASIPLSIATHSCTAFWDGTRTRIYSGGGEPFAAGLTGQRRIYTGDGTPWRVVAMTAGDYDRNGRDELLVAFDSGTNRHVCRASTQLADELSPVESCASIYSSSTWRISALTTAREDGGDRVYAAFVSSLESRVHAGDGMTSLTNVRSIQTVPGDSITAMVAAEVGDVRPQLVTAFTRDGITEVWRGSSGATNGAKNIGTAPIYTSSSFRITHLLATNIRDDAFQEIVTVFQRASGTQIWEGRVDNLLATRKLFEWSQL